MDGRACRGWLGKPLQGSWSSEVVEKGSEDPNMSFLLFPANYFVMDLSGPFLILSCCFRGGLHSFSKRGGCKAQSMYMGKESSEGNDFRKLDCASS